MHSALERMEVEVLGDGGLLGQCYGGKGGLARSPKPAHPRSRIRLPTGDPPDERVGHHQQTAVSKQVDGAGRLGPGDAQPASEDHHGVTSSGDGQPPHPRDLGAIDPLGLIPHRVGVGGAQEEAGRARQV